MIETFSVAQSLCNLEKKNTWKKATFKLYLIRYFWWTKNNIVYLDIKLYLHFFRKEVFISTKILRFPWLYISHNTCKYAVPDSFWKWQGIFVWGILMRVTCKIQAVRYVKTSCVRTTGLLPYQATSWIKACYNIQTHGVHCFIFSLLFYFLYTAKYFNIQLYLLQPKYWFWVLIFSIHLNYLNYAQNPLKIQTFTL